MNVNIDLERGTTNLKMNEVDEMFTFDSQNQQTNKFLSQYQDQNTALSSINATKSGSHFIPFSVETGEKMQFQQKEDPLS